MSDIVIYLVSPKRLESSPAIISLENNSKLSWIRNLDLLRAVQNIFIVIFNMAQFSLAS